MAPRRLLRAFFVPAHRSASRRWGLCDLFGIFVLEKNVVKGLEDIATMKRLGVFVLALVSVIYLLNPTAGVFEFLPDNIPFVGNVDEGLAAYVLYSCIEYLRGRQIGMFRDREK
jgi:hypothetical protein